MTAVAKDTKVNGVGQVRRFRRIRRRTSRRRIVLAAVTAFRFEQYTGEHTEDVRKLLDLAEEAVLERSDVQAGWACLNAARRMQILTFSPDRLLAESIALQEEAADLSGWRGKAIDQLVKEVKERTEKESEETNNNHAFLYRAREIRDEGLQYDFYKVAILREQLFILGCILASAVVGLLIMAMLFPVSLEGRPTTTLTLPNDRIIRQVVDGKILIYMALLGALGGSLSAIQWVIKASTAASGLPEWRLRGPQVYMRPLYGVAAALAIFPFLLSGLLPVESNENAVVFAIALVAGFTERFVAAAVGSVAPAKG